MAWGGLLKMFMKAKQMSDTEKEVEKMEPLQTGPGNAPQYTGGSELAPEMLGSGGARQAAEAMRERTRRMKALERDLFY